MSDVTQLDRRSENGQGKPQDWQALLIRAIALPCQWNPKARTSRSQRKWLRIHRGTLKSLCGAISRKPTRIGNSWSIASCSYLKIGTCERSEGKEDMFSLAAVETDRTERGRRCSSVDPRLKVHLRWHESDLPRRWEYRAIRSHRSGGLRGRRGGNAE
jgi:hypothetical protein